MNHVMTIIAKILTILILAIVSLNVSAHSVSLYGLFEKKLVNKSYYMNPFSDVELKVSYFSPSGRKIDFFGFYDGDGNGGQEGNIWKIRFMPDEVGTWRYRYSWSDGTRGGTGNFNCTAAGKKPGPWRVNRDNPFWLTDSLGNHFLPISLHANTHLTPKDWQDAIHWAKTRGFNTIITATINTTTWGDGWTNPTAFIKATGDPHAKASGSEKLVDPDRYNLEMWKEWDNMILTAGENGIYIGPFSGAAGKYGGQDGKYPPASLMFMPKIRERFDTPGNKRLLKYLVARQGAFWNVAYWSMGDTEVYYYAVADEAEFQEYISYLALITPWNRLITAQDCEQWHDKERRWLFQSSIPNTRKLNTLQTAVSSTDYPHWGKGSINNAYWQEARPNNELALDSYAGFPMLCTECLWEGQGRAEKPLRIIWGMLTAGAHTMWADWRYGDEGDPAEHKWGSIGRGWVPVKPFSQRIFTLSQLGANTEGDEQLIRALELLSSLEYWLMRPHNELVTDNAEVYCLAAPGAQYLVYAPNGGNFGLRLPAGSYKSNWFNPRSGESVKQQILSGGHIAYLQAPSSTDWVLVVKKLEPGDQT